MKFLFTWTDEEWMQMKFFEEQEQAESFITDLFNGFRPKDMRDFSIYRLKEGDTITCVVEGRAAVEVMSLHNEWIEHDGPFGGSRLITIVEDQQGNLYP